MQYQQDTPVAPRFDVNAPDLYIPGFTLPLPCTLLSLPGLLGWVCGCLEAQGSSSSGDQCLCVCLPQQWLSSPTFWWLVLRWGPRIGKGGLGQAE